MTTSAPTAALLLLMLACGAAHARRGPMPFERCSSSGSDMDKDTVIRILRNLEVPDETSNDQKCMLRCVLMAHRLVRDGVVNTKQILMNIRGDVHMASMMSSFYGQNISVDFERLSSDMDACVTSEENPDCDTVYNQFKCVSDLISNGKMATYASFVEAEGSETADWMRRRQLQVGRPRGPPGATRGRGGPHGHGGPRRGGRPPPPPPESTSVENDVEQLD